MTYRLFDMDEHCYEQEDSFTRYIDPAYADQAVVHKPGAFSTAGTNQIAALDSRVEEGNLVVRPGSLKEFLRKMSQPGAEATYEFEVIQDSYLYRDARLQRMDEQGVEATLIFPSVAVTAEAYIPDTGALYANYHAFNRWYDEEWGFNHQNRIFAPPYVSLRDVDRAIAEVEWVLERGAKVVSFRTGPASDGLSPADPRLYPLWARLNEADVTVAYHITECGYNGRVSTWWGEDGDAIGFRQSAWQWTNCYGDRAIMDTLSALVFGNIFGKFPNLQVVTVEHGCEWLPYIVHRMDKMRGMGRNGPWVGGKLTERPSEIVRRHVVAAAYPEDDVAKVVHELGHADSVALGSDYPHAEGLADPNEFREQLVSLSEPDQRKILHDNGRRLVGLAPG